MVAYFKDQRKEHRKQGSKSQQNANKMKETTMKNMAAQPAQSPNTKKLTKFAGRKNQLTPLPTNANHDWNADTGASAHMTPH